MLLATFWLLARIGALWPQTTVFSGIADTLFYLFAAACLARPVLASRNRRNYIAVAALLLLGGSHIAFYWQWAQGNTAALRPTLWAGLLVITGFIGLIGMRVIPFFTARRLGSRQVQVAKPWALSALLLPMLMVLNLLLWPQNLYLMAVCGLISGAANLWQLGRWWQAGVKTEPLLWILFAGFGICALGLIAFGIGSVWPMMLSLGVHLIAVGGIGVLTLGMMARTALGHTGRTMRLTPPLTLAFWLMLAALLLRLAAIVVAGNLYTMLIYASALAFAIALLLYAWRYLPWLLTPRTDGKPG